MDLLSKTTLIAASSLLTIVLAGCEDQSAETVGRTIDQTIERAADVIDDATITTKIKTAIAREPNMSALQINVDTNNGAVTLTGTVDSKQTSDRATEIAQSVNGVKAVVNRLTVKSTSIERHPVTHSLYKYA